MARNNKRGRPPTRRKPDPEPDPASTDYVWVIVDADADGNYFPAVTCGKDVSIPLGRNKALLWAQTVLALTEHAVHDASVVELLRATGVGDTNATMTLKELRADRPDLDLSIFAPLGFEPMVGSRDYLPWVTVKLNDVILGKWAPSKAREHAMYVLTAATTADLDAAARTHLSLIVGDSTARSAVDDLGRHRRDDHHKDER
jgi:hypothetical protein